MYTEDYEAEIDLKDLFFSILYRWRILVLVAAIGAVVLGGYKGLKGNEVQNVLEEGYEEKLIQYKKEKRALERTVENLESSIMEQNEYIAEAPIMQINPYNEFVSTAEILIESKAAESRDIDNVIKSYMYALSNGDYIEKVAEKLGTEQRYIKELINVDGGIDSDDNVGRGQIVLGTKDDETIKGVLQICIVGADRQKTEELLSAVLDEMKLLNDTFNTTIVNHKLTVLREATGEQVDTELLIRQQSVRENVGSLQKSLADFSKSLQEIQPPVDEHTAGNSEKAMLKYAVLGFLGGGFAAVFFVCVMYVLNDRVVSDKEIINRFRLKSLGVFSKTPKKRAFGFVDNWLHRLAGDDKSWSDKAVLEMIITNINNYAASKNVLFITGQASQELIDKVCAQLCSALPEVRFVSERDMIANASARRRMAECEAIVLVEERAISKYSGIKQELEIARNVGVEVVGVIVA